MLTAASSAIAQDGSTLVMFQGLPYMRVTWGLVGTGSLTNVSEFTDGLGLATAIFVPSAPDQLVTVSVSYAT